MKKKELHVAVGGLSGVLLSHFISGENNYVAAILGGIFGVGMVLLIMRLYKKREQNNVPEHDERLDAKISKFLNYLSIIAFGVLWIAVFVYNFLGYQSIDLDYINGFFLLVLFTFLTGLSILKKK